MYSCAGQLYTALRTVCQGIKGISAGLTGFSGELLRNARARERSDVGGSRCRFLWRYSVCLLAV